MHILLLCHQHVEIRGWGCPRPEHDAIALNGMEKNIRHLMRLLIALVTRPNMVSVPCLVICKLWLYPN